MRPLISKILSAELDESDNGLPSIEELKKDVENVINNSNLATDTIISVSTILAEKYNSCIENMKKAIFRILEDRIVLLQERRKEREFEQVLRRSERIDKSEGRRYMWLSDDLAAAMNVKNGDIQSSKIPTRWIHNYIKTNGLMGPRNKATLDETLTKIFQKHKSKTIHATMAKIEELLKKTHCITFWVSNGNKSEFETAEEYKPQKQDQNEEKVKKEEKKTKLSAKNAADALEDTTDIMNQTGEVDKEMKNTIDIFEKIDDEGEFESDEVEEYEEDVEEDIEDDIDEDNEEGSNDEELSSNENESNDDENDEN